SEVPKAGANRVDQTQRIATPIHVAVADSASLALNENRAMNPNSLPCVLALSIVFSAAVRLSAQPPPPSPNSGAAEKWRGEQRLIDLHQHIDYKEDRLARAVRIMDASGIGISVNLSGGVVTHAAGEPSEFERNKRLADRL